MKNLAKRNPTQAELNDINETVKLELIKAGITVIHQDPDISEVLTHFKGVYEHFSFTRAWYYWIVSGYVPMSIALKIYENPNCTKDVRAGGDCSAPSPDTRHSHIIIDKKTKKEVISDKEYDECALLTTSEYMLRYIKQSNVTESASYVNCYHIDTQEGLNKFMDIIRENNVTGEIP